MIEWSKLTSDEVGRLDRRLPVIIPLGLIEAHGAHLPLSVDVDCAEYFTRRVAEGSGAILAPLLSYGFADEMREYPGTVGLSADTLAAVITDISSMFCFHNFTRQIYLSGHGANQLAVELAIHRVWEKYPKLRAAYWNYWSEAGFNSIHHADKAETEIAVAVGIGAKMDRVRDSAVAKPWYRIRSRFELDPDSGGINGQPSEADPNEGRRMRDQIIHVLVEKVIKIIQEEGRQ